MATKEHKNTIVPEHVIKALQELGFNDQEFLKEINLTWSSFKEDAKSEGGWMGSGMVNRVGGLHTVTWVA